MDQSIPKGAETISRFCRLQMKKKMDIPVRPSEMGVLIFVHEQASPVTPLNISQAFNMTKPSVTFMVASLIKGGYLVKYPSQKDKRSYTLKPTAKGKALVKNAFDDYHETITRLKREMGKDRFKALLSLLEDANAILSEEH